VWDGCQRPFDPRDLLPGSVQRGRLARSESGRVSVPAVRKRPGKRHGQSDLVASLGPPVFRLGEALNELPFAQVFPTAVGHILGLAFLDDADELLVGWAMFGFASLLGEFGSLDSASSRIFVLRKTVNRTAVRLG